MDLDTPAGRLKWAREHKSSYETATAAAKAFGWTVPTYLGHENGDRNPSRAAAKKYGSAYKVPWVWILEGGPLPGSKPPKSGPIPTRGEVAAGQWLDLDSEVDLQEIEQHPVAPDPAYPHDAQYALVVRGNSINRVASPGDVLHCLDVVIARIEPEPDDIVIVERTRAQGSQKEVTAKRIGQKGRLIVLSPDSTDSKWKPITFDPHDGHDSDEEVRVVAVVLSVTRPLRKRRS